MTSRHSSTAVLLSLLAQLACPRTDCRAQKLENLYLLETTLPASTTDWYNEHQADVSKPVLEWPIANVYEAPADSSRTLGTIWTRSEWDPYLHFSLSFQPHVGRRIMWRDDVGDWGYGIYEFVLAVENRWVLLPPGPWGSSGWVRLVSSDERDGFSGAASSIEGRLVGIYPVSALNLASGQPETVAGTVFVESIGAGFVQFRPEVPSDMPCGGEPAADPDVAMYRSRIFEFVDVDLQARFWIAYPKGC